MSIINNKSAGKKPLNPDTNFVSIVENSSNIDKIDQNAPHEPLSYYCKNCKKIIKQFRKINKWHKVIYICNTCWDNKISRWTRHSIINYYKLIEA